MKNQLFSELRWQSTDLVWRGTYVWRVVSSYVTINWLGEGTNICMKSMLFYALTPWLDSTYCCHMEQRNEESTLQWTQVTINWLGVETKICMKSLIFSCDNQLTWRGYKHMYEEYALLCSNPRTGLYILLSHGTKEWRIYSSVNSGDNQLAWRRDEHMYEESYLLI